MAKHGETWGGELTLIAACAIWEAEIFVFSSISAEQRHISAPPECGVTPIPGRQFVLGHYAEDHYSSTFPEEEPPAPPEEPTTEEEPTAPPEEPTTEEEARRRGKQQGRAAEHQHQSKSLPNLFVGLTILACMFAFVWQRLWLTKNTAAVDEWNSYLLQVEPEQLDDAPGTDLARRVMDEQRKYLSKHGV